MKKNPFDTYRAQDLDALKPGEALIRVFDQCIQHLEEASVLMRAAPRDEAKLGEKLHLGHTILFTLCDSLDSESYPDLTSNLEGLYLRLMQSLTNAHLRNDVDEVLGVVAILIDLRDAWTDASREVEGSP